MGDGDDLNAVAVPADGDWQKISLLIYSGPASSFLNDGEVEDEKKEPLTKENEKRTWSAAGGARIGNWRKGQS